jgi:hypothetical protein
MIRLEQWNRATAALSGCNLTLDGSVAAADVAFVALVTWILNMDAVTVIAPFIWRVQKRNEDRVSLLYSMDRL